MTRGEIDGLTAGLLVSDHPPLGHVGFTDWLAEHRASLGRAYARELQRHFR